MCGIAGVFCKAYSVDDVNLVSRMCGVLRHRGPDDHGVHVGQTRVLGHTRLSIIDLSGDHQPLSNEDGTVWVTFDGEIYNYLKLRKELVASGHQFKTTTDTEVLVHLYEEVKYYIPCACWNIQKRQVTLEAHAVERYGIYGQISEGSDYSCRDSPGWPLLGRQHSGKCHHWMPLSVISLNQRSTMFSQELEVGVK